MPEYSPILVSPASVMPVSLDDAKSQLRVDHSDDDALISRLIESATGWIDGWSGVLGRAIMQQTWRQQYDSFASRMRLVVGPVLSVSSITYHDIDGNQQTVSSDVYALRNYADWAYVSLANDKEWPSHDGREAGIEINYVSGHASPGEVPAAIKHAILMLVASWYENREAVGGAIAGRSGDPVEIPLGVHELLAPYKRSYLHET